MPFGAGIVAATVVLPGALGGNREDRNGRLVPGGLQLGVVSDEAD